MQPWERFAQQQPSQTAQQPWEQFGGTGENAPTSYDKRADNTALAIEEYKTGKTGSTQAGFRVLGQGLGAINDWVGEQIPQPVKDAASYVYSANRNYNPLVAPALRAVEQVGGAAGSEYSDFAKNNPGRALDLAAAGNLGSVVSLGIPAPRAVSIATDAVKVAPELAGTALTNAGGALIQSAAKKSLAKQVGAEQLATWSGKVYDAAHAAGGNIPPRIFSESLDKAASALPKSPQAQAAFGKGAAANYVESQVPFRGKPLSFAAAEELDKGLGSQITQAYRAGDNAEAARLISSQQALRDAVSTLPEASAEVTKAKGLWSASANQRRVESILERAQYMDNPATSIKTGFRQLAMEVSKNSRGWTLQEVHAIKRAAKTGIVTDALKIAGSRLVPMFAGASGGPLGALAGYAASTGSRSAAEVMQAARAGKVTKAIMSRPVVQGAIQDAVTAGELTAKSSATGRAMQAAGRALTPQEISKLPPAEAKQYLKNLPEQLKKLAKDESGTVGNARYNTPEFKSWSGGAPVVSRKEAPSYDFKTGKPVVVEGLHGTRSGDVNEFRDFAAEEFNESPAFFFGNKGETASSYAEANLTANDAPNVIPAHLRMENPLVVDAKGSSYRDIPYNNGKFTSDYISAKAASSGHDGVIIRNVRDDFSSSKTRAPSDVYVVFSPTQIKSIHNVGTYSKTDPNILRGTGIALPAAGVGAAGYSTQNRNQ